jgi:two-component system CheB/CheR fusion protein
MFTAGGIRPDDHLARGAPPRGSYGALHQHMVERYALPSILVGPGGKVVHVSQHAGRYLQVAGGELTANVFHLVRPELSLDLHTGLHHATADRSATRSRPIDVTIDGVPRQVVVHVRPASGGADEEGYALIVFDEVDPVSPATVVSVEEGHRTREVEGELTLTRQRLQSLTEEYESSREEMRSTNEELQSTNEELVTLNQENRHKVEELSQMSSDLQNLIVATDIPTLFSIALSGFCGSHRASVTCSTFAPRTVAAHCLI